MEGRVTTEDDDAVLEYATLRIFPSQNRYEAFVCGTEGVEKLGAGQLVALLPHLPGVRDLNAKGTNATFKLQVTGDFENPEWFNKSTLNRFLQIVGSPDLVNATKVIEGEMSQLEESRKFHLTLYAEANQSRQADDSYSNETGPKLEPEVKTASSDPSKNQLLQAMDLRLAALKADMAAAIDQAVSGATYSTKEVCHLFKFCGYFGATNLTNCLQKRVEQIQNSVTVAPLNNKNHTAPCISSFVKVDNANEHSQESEPVPSVTPVQYGVSPALVAQVERQSSSESEDSFESSGDENETSIERRSRASTRSAAPRRSASPMRRVQLGRSGSRRATAIAIKSLGYPIRDRHSFSSPRDVINNEDKEWGEEETRKPENNVTRMSVQAAISLFESKQKPQNENVQKRSSTDKSVLRRWSGSVPLNCNSNAAIEGTSKHLVGDKPESDSKAEVNTELDSPETANNSLVYPQADAKEEKRQESAILSETKTNELHGNDERGQHMEADLSNIASIKNIAKDQLVKTKKSQRNDTPSRGGFYEQYKEKRDKKLQADNDSKRVQQAQLKLMQQILDEKKAKISSKKNSGKDAGKPEKPKNGTKGVGKFEKSIKNQALNSRKEISKALETKHIPPRTSTFPATRKSWPSTPPSKVASSKSLSPSKATVGATSLGKLKSSIPRSSAKVEIQQTQPLPHRRNAKEVKTDNERTVKVVKEKKQNNMTESPKNLIQKNVTRDSGNGSAVPSVPRVYNKFTKKSSVVPLDSKSTPRDKVPRRGSAVPVSSTASKAKTASQESSVNCDDKSGSQCKTMIEKPSELLLNEQNDQDFGSPDHLNAIRESDPLTAISESDQLANKHGETVTSNQLEDMSDCLPKVSLVMPEESREQSTVAEPHAQVLDNSNDNEELEINPAAWQEIVEQEHASHQPCPFDKTTRVRHSLSQMLQEDHNEPDPSEWGNAENAPALVFQKDSSPKGLKRLLKFTRKGKGGDVNVTGWSSPLAFSEGEEDTEESKSFDKRERGAEDSPRSISLLHSKNNGQKKTSFASQSNGSRFSADKLNQASARASTTKGTRSFFSLSAFRGSKSEESKFH